MARTRVALIVLAAGKSTRMGRNKLLLPVDGKPMVRRVVETGLASKASEVIVVIGHEDEKIRDALVGLNSKFVLNEEYERGQSFSVRRGLDEIKDRAGAMMILPGDVAMVQTQEIDAVIEEFWRHPSPIVVASHAGQPGHPILFSRELFNEISQINEETLGLKSVTTKNRDSTKRVETRSKAVLLDIDTPEDYRLAVGDR